MQVLQEVEKIVHGILTEYDRSDIASGTVRWQKSAEWEVKAMRDDGLLKTVGETAPGVWALTSAGSEEAAPRADHDRPGGVS